MPGLATPFSGGDMGEGEGEAKPIPYWRYCAFPFSYYMHLLGGGQFDLPGHQEGIALLPPLSRVNTGA